MVVLLCEEHVDINGVIETESAIQRRGGCAVHAVATAAVILGRQIVGWMSRRMGLIVGLLIELFQRVIQGVEIKVLIAHAGGARREQ